MMSSGSNFLGLYGQSPRHAAALYTDARDSMRQASSTAASRRRSMQPPTVHNVYEEPQLSAENTKTPPPPYSCRSSVLPETLPTPTRAASLTPEPSPRTSPNSPASNSPAPTSRSQKRRSSVMIKEFGMRILYAK
ncbi:hypothetical protein CTheo_7914 [Ceratobasidium theobromae]|uniref:Uncharacterized protein n=1 Tax=Ceratobasidium theobromae TaxID=1582974 RepID=A0A5N5QAV7_9AGAM|nr:hypothetical protein CTheo_7914 [Ceratobasidium theobromae]